MAICARAVLVPKIKFSPHICAIFPVYEERIKNLTHYCPITSLPKKTHGTKCVVNSEDGATIFDIWFYMDLVKERCRDMFFSQENCSQGFRPVEWLGK